MKALAKAADKELTPVVYAGADIITTIARKSIVQGAVQGAGHIPSAPGEPPNRDTGDLDSKITTRIAGKLRAQSVSASGHAAPMEYGTAFVAERPYMRPAAKRARPMITKLLDRAVQQMVAKQR